MFLKLVNEATSTVKNGAKRLKQISNREIDIIFKQYSGKAIMDFEKFIEALAHVSYICLD
jgi:hypothetical protein